MLCAAQALRRAAETLSEGVSPQPALPQPSRARRGVCQRLRLGAGRESRRASAAAPSRRHRPRVLTACRARAAEARAGQPGCRLSRQPVRGRMNLKVFAPDACGGPGAESLLLSQPVKCPKQGVLWAISHALTFHRTWANQSCDVVRTAGPSSHRPGAQHVAQRAEGSGGRELHEMIDAHGGAAATEQCRGS